MTNVHNLTQPEITFQLHTSAPVAGTLAIPDRLTHIPEAEDPGFFEMVEYFFHKSCVLIEDRNLFVNEFKQFCNLSWGPIFFDIDYLEVCFDF